jgi:hypothetical protein
MKFTARFTLGALVRGTVRQKLKGYLAGIEGISYDLDEDKGFLESDFLLTVSGDDEQIVERVKADIRDYFDRARRAG